jgi:glycosyltransferase involved in cell wall biosynthesis
MMPGAGLVYVDSESSDDSRSNAARAGADVVDLDMSRPFSAARARNIGAERLKKAMPEVEFVQFVDGDCEIVPAWMDTAVAHLASAPGVAAVAGRLRERNPGASIYNRLCDMEWRGAMGDVAACGGIAMMRASALQQVGGFNESLIAGEEPELCLRLRMAGWKIRRLGDDMAWHDAAMTRFAQWWRRSTRTGWAYAAGARLHGTLRGGHNVRPLARAFGWGLIAPGVLIGASVLAIWNAWLLAVAGCILVAWGVLGARVYRHRRRAGDTPADARLYAAFNLIGKMPEALGALRYARDAMGGRSRLIEYK